MKFFKKTFLLLTAGMLVGTISGCNKEEEKVVKDPLVIPTVDVENMHVNLPTLPTYNTGAIKSDGTYDYIDLYEISDFHGAVDFKESSSGEAYPGLGRLATYFDQRREENKGGTVILSTGDMFQGSADSNSTRGYMVNYAMQYMGFDAMALGNHEFDWTDAWIRKNANLTYNTKKIPYLGINILRKDTNELPDFLSKSAIIERGGYKIGVVGAIGSGLTSSILYSCIENYKFVSEGDLISAEAARLKSEEHCDAVVLLEHQGVKDIPAVTGVDAIFGGHAHENVQESKNGVPALATRNYGRGVAHIELKINKSTKQVSSGATGIFRFNNESKTAFVENAGIKAIMKEYEPAINSIKNIELGTAKDLLKFDEALKNICTSSMFESANASLKANTSFEQLEILGAFHNVNGGIRDDIREGKITYGSVYAAFPFDNEVVLIKAKGTLLKNRMKNFSNLGVYRTFSTSADIDPNKYYYIATTDFLALSADGFNGNNKLRDLTDADLIRTGAIVRDIVAEKIYKVDTIKTSDFSNSEACYKNIPITW